jgi:2-isopropylmalate synthase
MTSKTNNQGRILKVTSRGASELIKHRNGPGERFVFSDHNNNPDSGIYTIVRVVRDVENPEMHIDDHYHDVDSLWLFEGDQDDLTGLTVAVKLGENWQEISSPASVFIPAKVIHNYRFIKGSGRYTNIVLAPGGRYNTCTE